LEHLAQKKIVHRDLKPENIMVDRDGYLHVIDFGTAKEVETRTYTIVGTPHYMSPEVISGKGHNQQADLWSLGVILYELVAG
jgi:cGMP-dependent protein kinase